MKTCINKNLRSANELYLSEHHFFFLPSPWKVIGFQSRGFSYSQILWHSSQMLDYKVIFLISKISSFIIIICF